MPYFFFDLIVDGQSTPDDTGLEMESLEAARKDAQRALGDLVRDAMPDGDHKEISLQIRDESGRTPLKVTITMQVEHG